MDGNGQVLSFLEYNYMLWFTGDALINVMWKLFLIHLQLDLHYIARLIF